MTEYLEAFGTTLVVFGVVLYAVMWLIAQWLKRVNTRLEAQLEAIQEAIESKFIQLDVEIDNGIYYCYNIKDHEFICQGSTAREIKDAFDARFPGKVAILNNADREELADLKAQILEMKTSES